MEEEESRYAAGVNLPGHLADDVVEFAHWEDAVGYLADIIDCWWNIEYDFERDKPEKDRDFHSIDARYIKIHTDLHNAPQPPIFEGISRDKFNNDWEIWIHEIY